MGRRENLVSPVGTWSAIASGGRGQLPRPSTCWLAGALPWLKRGASSRAAAVTFSDDSRVIAGNAGHRAWLRRAGLSGGGRRDAAGQRQLRRVSGIKAGDVGGRRLIASAPAGKAHAGVSLSGSGVPLETVMPSLIPINEWVLTRNAHRSSLRMNAERHTPSGRSPRGSDAVLFIAEGRRHAVFPRRPR